MKLRFNVEDYSFEEMDGSHFSKIKMKIAKSGDNLHDLPITKDAIRNSIPTLFGKPILAYYYEDSMGVGKLKGHDDGEQAVGVLLDREPIIVSEGGEDWIIATGYIWKKYFPNIMDVFRNNKENKSPISMEIEVLETKDMGDEKTWIDSFSFLGVTLIGVTPAIPGAEAEVLMFSKILEEAKKEFAKYDDIDFSIPTSVVKSCKDGLRLRQEYAVKGSPFAVSIANYVVTNKSISPDKVRRIAKWLSKNKENNFSDKKSEEWVNWLLWGGSPALKWSTEIVSVMDKIDNREAAFYSSSGIVVDDYLAVENTRKEKEIQMNDDNKDDKILAATEENAEEEGQNEENMSSSPPGDSNTSRMESPEEQDEENENDEDGDGEEEGEEGDAYSAEFANASPFDILGILDFAKTQSEILAGEKRFEHITRIVDEIAKGTGASNKNIGNHMFQYMKDAEVTLSSYKKSFAEMESELAELRQYKAESTAEKFSYEVESVLNEATEAGMPFDRVEELREESKAFTLDNVDTYKNMVKAKAFVFASKTKVEGDPVVIALPFEARTKKKTDIWE